MRNKIVNFRIRYVIFMFDNRYRSIIGHLRYVCSLVLNCQVHMDCSNIKDVVDLQVSLCILRNFVLPQGCDEFLDTQICHLCKT